MSQTMLSAILWGGAAVSLVLFLVRRRRRQMKEF
jgi:LPXTG-motif cell wall-anchored protein